MQELGVKTSCRATSRYVRACREGIGIGERYEFLLIQIANSVNLSKLKLINFVTALCLIELQQRQELFCRGNNNNGYHHQLG